MAIANRSWLQKKLCMLISKRATDYHRQCDLHISGHRNLFELCIGARHWSSHACGTPYEGSRVRIPSRRGFRKRIWLLLLSCQIKILEPGATYQPPCPSPVPSPALPAPQLNVWWYFHSPVGAGVTSAYVHRCWSHHNTAVTAGSSSVTPPYGTDLSVFIWTAMITLLPLKIKSQNTGAWLCKWWKPHMPKICDLSLRELGHWI